MPALSRWLVKSAFICLVLGTLLTGVITAGAGRVPALVALQPITWHLLTVGWATQLIFGVALWMFPLAAKPPATAAPRPQGPAGKSRLEWGVFVLLDAGLVLRAIGEPANTLAPAPVWGLLLPVSALFQFLAFMLFIAIAWPRIRPLGR